MNLVDEHLRAFRSLLKGFRICSVNFYVYFSSLYFIILILCVFLLLPLFADSEIILLIHIIILRLLHL